MLRSEKSEFQQEIQRQLIHAIVGLFCIFLYMLLDRITVLAVLLAALVVGYWVSLQIKHNGRFQLLHEIIKRVERPHEQHWPGLSIFLFLAGAILTIATFTKPWAVVAGLVVLTLGDSIATIVGKYQGKIELVTNRTLEGTVAGIILSSLALLFLFQLPIAIAISTIGMLAEYLPIDDNIGVPLVAGLAASLLI